MAFSTRQYSWSDVKIVVLGRTLTGVQGIEYTRSVEKEYVYGRGSKPLAIQTGNESVEGTLMLLQSELEQLTVAAKTINPTYSILDIQFDIVVSYGEGINSVTDVISGASITEYNKGLEQNDKYAEIELPFMALDIKERV
jgi:hypothetical protein